MPLNETVSPARKVEPAVRRGDRGLGPVPGGDRDRRGDGLVAAVGQGEPGGVVPDRAVDVGGVGLVRGLPVTEDPRVGERSTLRVARPGARERHAERRRAAGRRGVGHHDGRLVGRRVPDAPDRAGVDGTQPADADVDVVEGTVGPLLDVDDLAVGAVLGAVRGLEVDVAGDVAVAVQGEPADEVAHVVAVEVGADVLLGNWLPRYTNPPVTAASRPPCG